MPLSKRSWSSVGALASVYLVLALLLGPSASAEDYVTISGEGSSWAGPAIADMSANVSQFGMKVNYSPTSSTNGRTSFLNQNVDFAASDIPFQYNPEDGSAPENPADKGITYAYIPVTAGGTAFMYNLKVNGKQVNNLRLSGENVSKIFTGVITKWNDPALQQENPGLVLPDRSITPVIRSGGSGSSAQFTRWMVSLYPQIWTDFCTRMGNNKCGSTSFYPQFTGSVAKNEDFAVTTQIKGSSGEGSIGYVNYSFALNEGLPVAKVLNAAGYYVEPTPENVAVSLLKAKINMDTTSTEYLTQQLDEVYTDPDPRNYQLSSYSYFILPTNTSKKFTEDEGKTLGAFAYYAMCEAQRSSKTLGYSPLPVNLVTASLEQIKKIPGVQVQNVDVKKCNNPTFSPDGTNLLAKNAPMPEECDKKGPAQCVSGTGGLTSPTGASSGAGAAAGGGGQGSGGANSDNPGGQSTGGGPTGPGQGVSGGKAVGSAGSVNSAAGGGKGLGTQGGLGSVCDPDTGACGVAGDGTNIEATGSVGSLATAKSTVLDDSSGWSSTKTLVALVFLLTLGLVFAPAFIWNRLSAKAESL